MAGSIDPGNEGVTREGKMCALVLVKEVRFFACQARVSAGRIEDCSIQGSIFIQGRRVQGQFS